MSDEIIQRQSFRDSVTNYPKNFLGVDPDMQFVALFLINSEGKPIAAKSVETGKHTGRQALVDMAKALNTREIATWALNYGPVVAAAVESQELYLGGGKTKNPRSIMQLASVAGMLIHALSELTDNIYFPAPQAWKGSVPKDIMQARICARAGLPYDKVGGKQEYCVPRLIDDSPMRMRLQTHWKDAIDSLGLAQYARATYMAETEVAARRQARGD